jgi:hypothetical protein
MRVRFENTSPRECRRPWARGSDSPRERSRERWPGGGHDRAGARSIPQPGDRRLDCGEGRLPPLRSPSWGASPSSPSCSGRSFTLTSDPPAVAPRRCSRAASRSPRHEKLRTRAPFAPQRRSAIRYRGHPSQGEGSWGKRAQGGNRTPDTGIFSPLLYRLSYLRARPVQLSHARSCVKRMKPLRSLARSSRRRIGIPWVPRRLSCRQSTR